MKSTFSIFTILIFSFSITLAQDVSFTFANAQNTNDGSNDYYEADVMISTTTDFKLGSGQIYLNYNTSAFGINVSDNSNIEYTYPAGTHILGQVSGFSIYGSFVDNDNTTSRVSFAWQQAVASGGFSNNVTTTAAALFHIKIKYADVNEDPSVCFEGSEVFDDQTYTACGPNSFALADCANYPGVQITTDNYDCVAAALPVELISFQAEKLDDYSLVTWETASELNNSHFEVEHSTDGRTFEQIGEVSGAGTTALLNAYEFTHTFPAKGNNYYRIKQVDYNGDFEYSTVAVVNFEGAKVEVQDVYVKVYPNPTTDMLIIEVEELTEEKTSVSIYNTLGQIVLKKYQINRGELNIINVKSLPSGTYFLRIQGVEKTIRFVRR